MQLNRAAREYYRLHVTTDPAVTAPWEASFDGGQTWYAGTDPGGDTGDVMWLVAGPDAEQGPAVAVLTGTVRPMLRAIDNPEIVIAERGVPWITVC